MAEPVGGCGVDPVDPVLEGAVDRGDRLLVVLGAPAELPATAADRPGAEADPGDLESGAAKLGGLQLRRLHSFSSVADRWRSHASVRPRALRVNATSS